jgi:hypothetical protein
MPVTLDHLVRPGQGTSDEYLEVLKLGKLPNIYMKFTTTGVASASKEPYPGFAYLRGKPTRNPAQLLFTALDQSDLDSRLVEALPWLTHTYADMDWNWLVTNAKLRDRQNRLGYVVVLARKLSKGGMDSARLEKLVASQSLLERSRLAGEDTLCHDSMTQAERKWLRGHRPQEARHWNLLTDLDVRNLPYASA